MSETSFYTDRVEAIGSCSRDQRPATWVKRVAQAEACLRAEQIRAWLEDIQGDLGPTCLTCKGDGQVDDWMASPPNERGYRKRVKVKVVCRSCGGSGEAPPYGSGNVLDRLGWSNKLFELAAKLDAYKRIATAMEGAMAEQADTVVKVDEQAAYLAAARALHSDVWMDFRHGESSTSDVSNIARRARKEAMADALNDLGITPQSLWGSS